MTAALAAADLAALSARVVARCYGHDSVHLASAPTRNAIARLAAAQITPARPRCRHRLHWPTFGRTSSTFEPPSP